MVPVEIIETKELGDRSYIAHDGEVAVVDPQRDIDRVQRLLAQRSLTASLACQTHRHDDYVTGGFALARTTGATYVIPAGEDVVADPRPVADGDEFAAGALRVRVVTTPGHTRGHCAHVVDDGDAPVPAVFTPSFATCPGWLIPCGIPLTLTGEDPEQQVPLHELPAGLDALLPGRLRVHCATGYRAPIAASLLDRVRRDVALVDDEYDNEYDNAARAGLDITKD